MAALHEDLHDADPENPQSSNPIGTGIEDATLEVHMRYIANCSERETLAPEVLTGVAGLSTASLVPVLKKG